MIVCGTIYKHSLDGVWAVADEHMLQQDPATKELHLERACRPNAQQVLSGIPDER
jgi:hypothetical protein